MPACGISVVYQMTFSWFSFQILRSKGRESAPDGDFSAKIVLFVCRATDIYKCFVMQMDCFRAITLRRRRGFGNGSCVFFLKHGGYFSPLQCCLSAVKTKLMRLLIALSFTTSLRPHCARRELPPALRQKTAPVPYNKFTRLL